MRCFQKINK